MYNDSQVTEMKEEDVRQKRQTSGYIFFYMHKQVAASQFDLEMKHLWCVAWADQSTASCHICHTELRMSEALILIVQGLYLRYSGLA